jgi:tripartite-type tricarboxylate transporter receptor subunit TctC
MRLHAKVSSVSFLLASLVFAPLANSAESAFYKGKTLTVLINYATGGPTDIEGRLVAKHIGKHIPGQPTVIVNNMAGAGGITATNFLGEVAKPDGLTMSYFTGNFFNILLADPSLRVDLSKFAYIASIEGSSVAYIRKDVPPGLAAPQDILKAQPFKAGGLSVASTKDVRFRLELDLLGAKYQYVTGYNSNSDARLAVQRNEIQFFVEGLPAYRATVEPQMVKNGLVVPLYANELIEENGELEANPEAPDLTPFSKLYQMVHKKQPSGPHWEALKVTYISQGMQRVAMMAPGTSPELVATLRQAFAAMVKDPEFVAEFKKITRSEPNYRIGVSGDKIVKRLQDTPAELKAFIKKYTLAK